LDIRLGLFAREHRCEESFIKSLFQEVFSMGKRILLVDDEPDIRSLYKRIIEREGYKVSTAASGSEALKTLEELSPDLIVLDIMMPGMDGWEVARRIRGDKRFSKVPIIMLTVKSEIEDKMRSIDVAGADRHLSKPVEVSELMGTIKALLNEI